jgi:Sec-independent protein translocase protein TatA
VLLRPRRATPLEVSMPGKLGLPEILLILAVGLGEGIKNFKSSIKEGEEPGEKKP